jgi:HEAT repeat protein
VENDEPPVREACAQALGQLRKSALTPTVVPALIAALRSRDRDTRLHVISLLSKMASDVQAVTPALIAVLEEPIDSDRAGVAGMSLATTYSGPAHEAAEALGRLAPGTPSAGAAIAALTKVVQAGPAQRRGSAADALGEFGAAAAAAVPPLIGMLKDPAASSALSRDGASAARALGRIAPGTPSSLAAVAALSAALKSESIATREGALDALPHFGRAAAPAIPLIRSVQENDPIPNVRKAAAAALEGLNDRSK